MTRLVEDRIFVTEISKMIRIPLGMNEKLQEPYRG